MGAAALRPTALRIVATMQRGQRDLRPFPATAWRESRRRGAQHRGPTFLVELAIKAL